MKTTNLEKEKLKEIEENDYSDNAFEIKRSVSDTSINIFKKAFFKKTNFLDIIQKRISDFGAKNQEKKSSEVKIHIIIILKITMVLRACQPLIKIAQSYKRNTPNLKVNTQDDLEKLPEPVISQKSPDYTPKISKNTSIFDFSNLNSENNLKIENEELMIKNFFHFLEEFLVIGVDNQDLRDPVNNYIDIMSEIRVQPKVLFSSKNRFCETKNHQHLASFLFPFGYSVKKCEKDYKKILENFLLKSEFSQKKENFYFFCLNSNETLKEEFEVESEILKEANPNMFYYYHCVFLEVFHSIVKN